MEDKSEVALAHNFRHAQYFFVQPPPMRNGVIQSPMQQDLAARTVSAVSIYQTIHYCAATIAVQSYKHHHAARVSHFPPSPYWRLQFRHLFLPCTTFFSVYPDRTGTSNISITCRTRHYFKFPFSSIMSAHYVTHRSLFIVLYHRYIPVFFRGSVFANGKKKCFRITTVYSVYTAARHIY